jgi:hypothetical protein
MALSFAIYPAYPFVPFLPISRWAMGETAVGMSAVSWGMFLVGSVLAGKDGVAYLKRRFSGSSVGPGSPSEIGSTHTAIGGWDTTLPAWGNARVGAVGVGRSVKSFVTNLFSH